MLRRNCTSELGSTRSRVVCIARRAAAGFKRCQLLALATQPTADAKASIIDIVYDASEPGCSIGAHVQPVQVDGRSRPAVFQAYFMAPHRVHNAPILFVR